MTDPDGRAADSLGVVLERVRSIADSLRETKDSVRDVETRVRRLEIEGIEELRRQMCRLEGKTSSFESDKDEQREKWGMALNFVIQLLWVVTAAFVLTKLGLNMGPT